jgi:hypothetical protein
MQSVPITQIHNRVISLPVEPNVDMDTGFANGHVVGDSHTAQGSISPLCDIYNSAQCNDIRRRLTLIKVGLI